jgi:hypothetical protein
LEKFLSVTKSRLILYLYQNILKSGWERNLGRLSERDSSRALNIARGSFASFLVPIQLYTSSRHSFGTPSRKEEKKFLDLFWTSMSEDVI